MELFNKMTKLSEQTAELNRLKSETERAVMLLNKTHEIQANMISIVEIKDKLNKLLLDLPGPDKRKINTCPDCKRYFLSYGKMDRCIDCSSKQIEEE